MAKQKHLTLENRFAISNLLDKCTSFKAIGIEIDKDCTTISKEVRNHLIFQKTGAVGKAHNACIFIWAKGFINFRMPQDCTERCNFKSLYFQNTRKG